MKKFIKNGFTFLEIMIAIGIFGIVSIVCLENYFLSLKKIKIVNDEVKFLILKEMKVEQLKIENEEIEETKGVFDPPYSEYEWEIGISDVVISDTEEEINMRPYKLTIYGPEGEYSFLLPYLKIEGKNE